MESRNSGAADDDIPVTNIKVVDFSRSILHDGTSDVVISFLVRRSDGEVVVVDNKYLKEKYPILLVNFYEDHLRPSVY